MNNREEEDVVEIGDDKQVDGEEGVKVEDEKNDVVEIGDDRRVDGEGGTDTKDEKKDDVPPENRVIKDEEPEPASDGEGPGEKEPSGEIKVEEDGVSVDSNEDSTVSVETDKEFDFSAQIEKMKKEFLFDPKDDTDDLDKYARVVRGMLEMEEDKDVREYYLKQLDLIRKHSIKTKDTNQLLLDLYSLLEDIRKAYMEEAIENRPELRGLYQGIKEVRKIKSELYDDLRRQFAGEHVNWIYELFGYAAIIPTVYLTGFKTKDEKQLSVCYQYFGLQTAITIWGQKLTLSSRGIWDAKTIRTEITKRLLTSDRGAVALVDKSNTSSMLLAFRRNEGNALDRISYHVFTRDRLAPVVHMWGFFMLETALKQIKKNGEFAFVDIERGPVDREDTTEILLNSRKDDKEIIKAMKTTDSHMGNGSHYHKHVKSHVGSTKKSKIVQAVTLGSDRYDEDASSEEYQPYL